MKDTKFECMAHGWRSDTQVCPFCMVLVLESDNAKLKKENEELGQNVCSDCSPDNYGWIFNRVEGRAACGCMTEAEPFQILLKALKKLACLGNGDRFGNSDGNRIAIDALRAVLPLDYAE